MEGAVGVFPFVGLAVLMAATLNGIAIMRAYFRIFTGRRFQTTAILRSRPSERFAVLVLTFLVLGGGLWPQPGVASRHHAAQQLLDLRMNPQKVVAPDDMSKPDQHDESSTPSSGNAPKNGDPTPPEVMRSITPSPNDAVTCSVEYGGVMAL